MKLQRVIHHLRDGRLKYSTHRGQIEKWEERDLAALRHNLDHYGDSAFLADFSRYGVVAEELHERFPKAKILLIMGFETEDHDLPLRTDVIF